MKNRIMQLLLTTIAIPTWAAQALPIVDVYKSPTCGCCNEWIAHLKDNGFEVRAHDVADMTVHKRRLGVPPSLRSCHTAEVNGYLVEGHVPAKEIKRLLQEKPNARGLAVPGMPVGSPGMEMGNRKDHYEVLLVDKQGNTRTYARY